MKKTAVVLFTVLALSIVSMAVAPALAKPYEVVAVIKNDGKPVVGEAVYLAQLDNVGGIIRQTITVNTNLQGKAVFTIDSTWDLTKEVALRIGSSTLTRESLSNKYSARLTFDYWVG